MILSVLTIAAQLAAAQPPSPPDQPFAVRAGFAITEPLTVCLDAGHDVTVSACAGGVPLFYGGRDLAWGLIGGDIAWRKSTSFWAGGGSEVQFGPQLGVRRWRAATRFHSTGEDRWKVTGYTHGWQVNAALSARVPSIRGTRWIAQGDLGLTFMRNDAAESPTKRPVYKKGSDANLILPYVAGSLGFAF